MCDLDHSSLSRHLERQTSINLERHEATSGQVEIIVGCITCQHLGGLVSLPLALYCMNVGCRGCPFFSSVSFFWHAMPSFVSCFAHLIEKSLPLLIYLFIFKYLYHCLQKGIPLLIERNPKQHFILPGFMALIKPTATLPPQLI